MSIFQRIADVKIEQERLIKEKIIKREKYNPTISEREDNLPSNWTIIKLGDISKVITKQTGFDYSNHIKPNLVDSPGDDDIPMLQTRNFKGKIFDFHTEYYISKKIAASFPKICLGEPCLLLSIVGASIGNVGYLEHPKEAIIGGAICKVTLIPDEFYDYIYYFLQSPQGRAEIKKNLKATAQGTIMVQDVREIEVPLPPYEEQCRIVEKIEELLPLIDEYDKAAVELETLNKILPDKLRKSVLQEAIHGTLVPNDIPEGEATGAELLQQILNERQEKENKEKGKKAKKLTLSTIEEEPWELPEGWCWCRGKDIFFPMESIKPKSDFVYIDTDAVNNKKNVIDNPKNVLLKNAPSRATRRLHANDILFSMVRPYLKNIAYVDERFASAIGTTGFYVITTSSSLYQPYIFKMMLSDYVVSGLTEYMKGDNSPSINNGHIEDFLYPIPPLSIQHRIVEKIEEVFSYIDQLKA